MDRRVELEAWIAQTRRLQRKLAWIYGGLAVPVLALALWRGAPGVLGLAFLGVVAVSTFWVTVGHTSAHRIKLDELARLERAKSDPLATAHRRWMRSS